MLQCKRAYTKFVGVTGFLAVCQPGAHAQEMMSKLQKCIVFLFCYFLFLRDQL